MNSVNRRRARRAKQSERDLGHFLLTHNGRDGYFDLIASSTGRVGHITDLQFDVVSLDYAAENKNVKVPVTMLKWWDQIVSVARDHKKHPMLRVSPSNDGRHEDMHIITAERHAELLEYEKRYRDRRI